MTGIYKRRRTYWLRFTWAGKRHFVSLQTPDQAEAIIRAREIRDDPAKWLDGSSEVETLIAEYLKEKDKRGVSKIWRENEETTLNQFVRFAEINRVSDITADRIRSFLASGDWKEKTVDDYRDRIARFCRWLVSKRRLYNNPCDDIPRRKRRPKPRRRFLSVSESHALLDACDGDLKTVVYLALHCGLRKGETLAARWSWVDLQNGLLHVEISEEWSPKDGEARTIPLTHELAKWLRPRKREPESYLVKPDKDAGQWRNRWEFRRAFDSALKKAGLENVTFHDLRRTFASLHVSTGTPLYVVAKWLGDGHAVVERHYGHLIAQDARINGPWT